MMELDVALAIALTLLLLSTLASMLVEILFKSLNMRKNDLKKMLEDYLTKHMQAEIPNWQAVQQSDHAGNPKTPEQLKQAHQNNINAVSALVTQLLPEASKERLSVTEFMHRLGETEIGRALYAKSADRLDDAMTYLVNKYEETGTASSRVFRTKAFWLTGFIGIAIAFALNVNIFSLGSEYASNQALRLSIIAKAENIEVMASQQMLRIENLGDNAQASAQEVKEALASFEQRLDEVQSYGIPMGYNEGRKPNQLFYTSFAFIENPAIKKGVSFVIWLFATVLTGVLIGLGSPFWFDVVKKLSVVRQYVGAMRRKQNTDKTDSTDTEDSNGAKSQFLDKDPVVAFKESIETRQALEDVRSGYVNISPRPSMPIRY